MVITTTDRNRRSSMRHEPSHGDTQGVHTTYTEKKSTLTAFHTHQIYHHRRHRPTTLPE